MESTAWPGESTIKRNKLEAPTVAYRKEFIEFLIFCLELKKHLCHFLGPLVGSGDAVVESLEFINMQSPAEFTRLGHAKSPKQTDCKLHMNWDKKATYQSATSSCAMLRFILRLCCHFIKTALTS